jgi:hypothetical protein
LGKKLIDVRIISNFGEIAEFGETTVNQILTGNGAKWVKHQKKSLTIC